MQFKITAYLGGKQQGNHRVALWYFCGYFYCEYIFHPVISSTFRLIGACSTSDFGVNWLLLLCDPSVCEINKQNVIQ